MQTPEERDAEVRLNLQWVDVASGVVERHTVQGEVVRSSRPPAADPRIIAARLQTRLSMEQAAEVLGLLPASYAALERGEARVNIDSLRRAFASAVLG